MGENDPDAFAIVASAHHDPFAIVAVACQWLKLRPTEARIMRDCLWARTQVPNGYFLVPGGSVPSARRLIERGYIIQAPSQLVPFDPKFGLVVLAEQNNWDKLIADANAHRARQREEAHAS